MLYDDTVTVGPPQVERDEHPFTGFVDFRGLPIDVENLRGSLREGVDRNGTEWTTVMLHHYGEVRGTVGLDNDPIDVYIGPDSQSDLVVVVHQNWPDTGKHDEDKCMLGFRTVEDAIEAYRAQYNRPEFYGGHDAFAFGDFALWCVARGAGGMRKGYVVTFKGASGGPYVGPQGGLWADPQHKVHWTPTAHGVQADWVGSEDDDKQDARAKRVERAVARWQDAADHYRENRTSQRAYQAAYDSLDELGRSLNLDVSKGEDFALAALKWLKTHGHKASLAAPRKATAAKRGEQGDLFKALTLAGFGDAYVRRLVAILGTPEYVVETP